MRHYGLLPVPFADRSRESDWDHRNASRPLFLPPDRHAGSAATVLPPPHVKNSLFTHYFYYSQIFNFLSHFFYGTIHKFITNIS